MSTAVRIANDEASGWRVYALAIYYVITGNISLSIMAGGILMIGFGASLEPALIAIGLEGGNIPYYAGMFGIWGATLLVLGTCMFIALFANAKYAELTTG